MDIRYRRLWKSQHKIWNELVAMPAMKSSASGNGTQGGPPPMAYRRRLRARQVLCSLCKSVCSENGDNVQRPSRRFPNFNKRNHATTVGREQIEKLKRHSLVPKIRRLNPDEIDLHRSHNDHPPSPPSEQRPPSRPLKIRLFPSGMVIQQRDFFTVYLIFTIDIFTLLG